jgi:DnaJ family protein A protein 2
MHKLEHTRKRLCQTCDGKGGSNTKECTTCKGKGMVMKMVMLAPGMY